MRISDCPHPIEQRAFRENAYLEWMTCLSCGARWSRKTGRDDIQMKMGLTIDQPQLTPPCPECASTTRLQQMTHKTETLFGCSRFPLCKRVVHTSHTVESRVSPSAHSCSAAQPMAEQVMVLDSDSVGSEESFTIHRSNNSFWNSFCTFRLLASRVRKHDGRSFECFQTNSRRSR